LRRSQVDLANNVSLDYYETADAVALQHLAFLVTEDEFDSVLARIRERVPQIWADPARTMPGQINHHFGGRGVYFEDPDGHLLEVITRPYGDEP
jgi:catechol 2,3-dioxygenase-like lactoylglutathione lyase family enzyme